MASLSRLQPRSDGWLQPLQACPTMAVVSREPHEQLDSFLASVEKRAFRIAELATRNREDALDIVQDSMLQLVRRYQRRPAEEWPPLFYRILENRIHDWRRVRQTRGRWWGRLGGGHDEDDTDAFAEVPDAPSADPLHALQRSNAMSRLEIALQKLPLRQQQVFLLRIWEGLDVADTARAVGCSEGSIKTHLSRALNALRQQLGEEWP